MKYVEEWKLEEINKTMEAFKEWNKKFQDLREDWKTNGGAEKFNKIQSMKYESKYFYSLSFCSSEERVLNNITRGVEEHFQKLQTKVEKVIGKIIEIKDLGNYYQFIGENGSCAVDVILAGGYNIQRLHTRWLIKK